VGIKLVLACGVFDGLHPGHIVHLQAARALGDFLVVGLTMDEHVGKGPGHPVIPFAHRALALKALRCVDLVVPSESAEAAIRRYKPNIYVKGKEYQGNLPEDGLVVSLGGRVVFTDTQPVYSSTRLLSGEELADRIRAAGTGLP
jgi:rfaE bifunctional protein nucleotidyltransferase chain/domain